MTRFEKMVKKCNKSKETMNLSAWTITSSQEMSTDRVQNVIFLVMIVISTDMI